MCSLLLDLAVAVVDLNILSLDTAELFSVAVCEIIHCLFSNVKSVASMINGENIDGLPVIRHTIAGATLHGVRTRAKRDRDVGLLEGSSTPQFLDIHQCKDKLGSGPAVGGGC